MIYVITEGSDSDYTIAAILSGPDGLNIDHLYKDFRHETGIDGSSDWDWRIEQCKLWSERMGLSTDIVQRDGTVYRSHADWTPIFVAWLVKTHGLAEAEYDETNLD